jgi:hypothetical protein
MILLLLGERAGVRADVIADFMVEPEEHGIIPHTH